MRHWISFVALVYCARFCISQGYDSGFPIAKLPHHCACFDVVDKKNHSAIPFSLQWANEYTVPLEHEDDRPYLHYEGDSL